MGTTSISKADIRAIYALGSVLGMVRTGDHDDDLHLLVSGTTGKSSVSELSSTEAHDVLQRLQQLMKGNHIPPAPSRRKTPETVPGRISSVQKGLAWRLIYRLQELDPRPGVAVGDRLCGAIRKILGVDASVETPFVWVTNEQATKLIEQLKRYVRSAEKAKGEHYERRTAK